MTRPMEVASLLGEGGPFVGAVEGFRPRADQIRLAEEAARTLAEGGVLIAEAGTGTGKTLAYLLPAVLSGKKVVISTATKTLQTQILERDAPLIERALGRPVSAALLKGRENYLCLRRFERMRAQRSLRLGSLWDVLEGWARRTATGDRSELTDLPEDFEGWRLVCASSESCMGSRCPSFDRCHLQARRKAAQRAQIVVVNHHLFFADLAVRSGSTAEVIPRYGAVVFDEAHHLESVATQYFGTRVSSHRVSELVRDAALLRESERSGRGRGKARPAGEGDGPGAAVVAAAGLFWAALGGTYGAVRLRGPLAAEPAERLHRLVGALRELASAAEAEAEAARSPEAEAVGRRALGLASELEIFLAEPRPGEVRWIEPRGRGVFLHAVPVDVGPILERALFGLEKPVLLTSATLRVGGGFDYIRRRLGVPPSAREIAVEGPFDHARHCLVYAPQGLCDPNDPAFPRAAAGTLLDILDATRGRAFCLFTSHRVLREVAAHLADRLPYRLLVQGEAPREVLLRQFREDVHSVLLGAQAFWEGVDVPGEALSAVIIDRLPFSSPGDPLVEARIEKIRSEGDSPFLAYQLPVAAMALRQGVGRLLRRPDDRGIVAILDRRFLDKSYGAFFRKSLPPAPVTRDMAEVRRFLGTIGTP